MAYLEGVSDLLALRARGLVRPGRLWPLSGAERGRGLDRMRTIGGVLDENRGLGGGFDFLRVTLALAVVTWHCTPVADGDGTQYHTRFIWLLNLIILQMFFGLSGFLIAGSALRLSLRDFLINRGLRIFPALAVEIILSALIIGPLLTALPLKQYFSNPQTYHYLTNIFGWMNYQLPGVFISNHTSVVNGSLWTVPWELGCYAIMSVFIVFRLLKRPWIPLTIAAVILIAGIAMSLADPHPSPPHGGVGSFLFNAFLGGGSRLLVGFCAGIAAYLYRYAIPYSRAGIAIATGWLLLVGGAATEASYAGPLIDLATAAPLTYVMAFVGVTRMPKLPLFHRGDYSYGIYLYGWPVEQTLLALFPWFRTHPHKLWFVLCPAITLFAMFSWHVIEKRVLQLRKTFSFVARQRLAQSGPEPGLAGPVA